MTTLHDAIARKLAVLSAEHDHAARRLREEETAVVSATGKVEAVRVARSLLQEVAAGVQAQAHAKIASVASRCLEAVFGEDAYRLKIDFRQKRGKTEAALMFERNGLVLENPLDEGGGGQVDVAAFALRLACLVLAKPRRRRFLVLDEPMPNLNGAEYQGRVADLLLTLADELDVQFLIASDDDWLRIGKVVEL